MDFDQIFSFVKENPFLLIVAYLLFKDKIDALFTKKPETVPVPVPNTTPVVVTPVVSPNDTPLIDAITKLLPIILPVLLQQAVAAQAAKKE
jgi:hypothetical protein